MKIFRGSKKNSGWLFKAKRTAASKSLFSIFGKSVGKKMLRNRHSSEGKYFYL